jgi:hypothetical protein
MQSMESVATARYVGYVSPKWYILEGRDAVMAKPLPHGQHEVQRGPASARREERAAKSK